MQHLLKQWIKIEKKLNNNFVCIFLDFDGTLTPIVSSPEKAILGKKTKNILEKLAGHQNCQIIIVSGRKLNNIKKLVGIKNIIYAGSHGFEFGNLQNNFEIPISKKYTTLLRILQEKIVENLAAIPGVLIEKKKFSLGLHYRLVRKEDIRVVMKMFNDITESYKKQGELTILQGTKTLEILPPLNWNKGNIVLLNLALSRTILKTNKIMSIYIGDDVTDENAFLALKNIGITACVGNKKKTLADYCLKDHREVQEFLVKLFSHIQKNHLDQSKEK